MIEEAGKFGAEVLDPLSVVGDRTGSKLVDGKVVTPPGWKEAYKQFAEGGWGGLQAPEEWGGQNLPHLLSHGGRRDLELGQPGASACARC